ncbi:MAG: hypothetical protein RID53_07775 [Coleofasciculus sp. B1-GNL1-01]|uniref:hypothetical protein n=1 Tax=Coleofasciculus sp. B1-GNL1-01 TaxID=3068484 RepID=UPI0032F7EDEF
MVASVEVVSFLSQFGQVADRRETLTVLSCHAFKLGMGSEQDAKPAAWLRLTHYNDFAVVYITV